MKISDISCYFKCMVLVCGCSPQLFSVLWVQRHAQTQKHATQQHIPTLIRKAARGHSGSGSDQPASAPSALQSRARLSLIDRLQSRKQADSSPPLPSPDFLHPGSYLKLAGEFTWMSRPGGGLVFLFSLSAMRAPFSFLH